MASGGIAPAQAQEWLDAGALAVGIGAQARSRPTPSAALCSDPCSPQLVGRDVGLMTVPSERQALAAEEVHWAQCGRAQTAALFGTLAGGDWASSRGGGSGGGGSGEKRS